MCIASGYAATLDLICKSVDFDLASLWYGVTQCLETDVKL